MKAQVVTRPYLGTPLVSLVYIDSEVAQNKRSRYSFWQLLGDAGGLHDGLSLIVSFCVGPFASNLFQLDIGRTNFKPGIVLVAAAVVLAALGAAALVHPFK